MSSPQSAAWSVEALLNDVPRLRTNNKPMTEVPKHLHLTEDHRMAINNHIETVGIDRYVFQHNMEDQGNYK